MATSKVEASRSNRAMCEIAVVLSRLPSKLATKLVDAVDASLKEELESAFLTLDSLSDEDQHLALQRFRGSLSQPPTSKATVTSLKHGDIEDEFQRGDNLTKSKSSSRLDRQVSSVVTQWELPQNSSEDLPFAFLDGMEDDSATQLLMDEHPQVIALALASITPKQAARLLPRLGNDVQAETLRRIESLDDGSPIAKETVAPHLKSKAERLQLENSRPGRNALQAIQQSMPEEFQESFIPIRRQHPEISPGETNIDEIPLNTETQSDTSETENTAEEIQDQTSQSREIDLYLKSIPPDVLCQGLGHVNTRDALLSLCGLPADVSDRAIAQLPRPRARKVRHGMRGLQSVRISEIDKAKQRVAEACQQIENEMNTDSVAA